MKKALLIIDHGSKKDSANDMLAQVAELAKTQKPDLLIEFAHMELASPTIEEGIELCVKKGATHIIASLFMLSPGRHAKEDIPEIVQKTIAKYPGVSVEVSDPLGVHPKLIDVLFERAKLS